MEGNGKTRVGQTLRGKYRLERVLGQGGFGVVYAGTHLGLDTPVAIKVLRPELVNDADVVGRFVREARAMSRLKHPNIIDVRDVETATAQEPDVFMVLELLEGRSLEQHLAVVGQLSLDDALAIFLPVLEALGVAHEAGVIHRDVKPDNVFLARSAEGAAHPKVLDFGIAKLIEPGNSSSTVTGMVIGTPYYMAPEQAMGQHKQIGPATDVWAAAVMIYEALTGTFPFDFGDNAPPTAVLLKLMTEAVIPLTARRPDLPVGLSAVIDAALVRETDQRTASMAALADGLRRAGKNPLAARTKDRSPSGHAPTVMLADSSASASEPPPARSPSQLTPSGPALSTDPAGALTPAPQAEAPPARPTKPRSGASSPLMTPTPRRTPQPVSAPRIGERSRSPLYVAGGLGVCVAISLGIAFGMNGQQADEPTNEPVSHVEDGPESAQGSVLAPEPAEPSPPPTAPSLVAERPPATEREPAHAQPHHRPGRSHVVHAAPEAPTPEPSAPPPPIERTPPSAPPPVAARVAVEPARPAPAETAPPAEPAAETAEPTPTGRGRNRAGALSRDDLL